MPNWHKREGKGESGSGQKSQGAGSRRVCLFRRKAIGLLRRRSALAKAGPVLCIVGLVMEGRERAVGAVQPRHRLPLRMPLRMPLYPPSILSRDEHGMRVVRWLQPVQAAESAGSICPLPSM